MDKDGFLYVLGRFKSLLIADDGEKYSPEGIEEAITDQSPLIEQCILHNNQKPYTVCLLFPNFENLKRKAIEAGINLSSEDGIHNTLKLLEKELNEYLEYIDYLQHEGLLTADIEHLDLEDTQGISGLKAIRVAVNLGA